MQMDVCLLVCLFAGHLNASRDGGVEMPSPLGRLMMMFVNKQGLCHFGVVCRRRRRVRHWSVGRHLLCMRADRDLPGTQTNGRLRAAGDNPASTDNKWPTCNPSPISIVGLTAR